MIKYVINEIPVSKKNSMRLVNVRGRIIPIPSAAYKKFEKACEAYLQHDSEPINYPVNIRCLFYMPTRRPVDISNLISAVDDILVHYKVIEDDNRDIVAGHDYSRVLYDKENPRVEINIRRMDGYGQWKDKQ